MRPQQNGAAEVAYDLDLHAHLVAHAHVLEEPEVVDRGEVAARSRLAAAHGQIGAATLRQRLEDERGREDALVHAGIGRAHELHERAAALADVDDAV